jgi:hypothetical protein
VLTGGLSPCEQSIEVDEILLMDNLAMKKKKGLFWEVSLKLPPLMVRLHATTIMGLHIK